MQLLGSAVRWHDALLMGWQLVGLLGDGQGAVDGVEERIVWDDEAGGAIQPYSAELWPLWLLMYGIHWGSCSETEDANGSSIIPFAS